MLRLLLSKHAFRAGLVLLLLAGAASAVELRDADLVPAADPVLQNASGSVRLRDARLGRVAPPIFVPEPDALLQLGVGIASLYLLADRRRRRTR